MHEKAKCLNALTTIEWQCFPERTAYPVTNAEKLQFHNNARGNGEKQQRLLFYPDL